MRQRVVIALALAAEPEVVIADEPTTALDVSVQAQVLNLLKDLQKELGMSVIFVTHDIGAAVEVSDKLAVMYAGKFIETGSVRDIIRDARHPYTRGLLAANLHDAARGQKLEAIPGSPPKLDAVPTSCSFAPRCPHAESRCHAELPPLVELGENRQVRCILAENATIAGV
jgi:peptide/nickel transport system ATP-binding protein